MIEQGKKDQRNGGRRRCSTMRIETEEEGKERGAKM